MTDVRATQPAVELEHERGLRLLGLWPGPFDGVAAARSRPEAAAELANVKALARAAKRVVARKHHPDLRRRGGDTGAMQAAIEAADWVEARKLEDVWSPRRRILGRMPGPHIERRRGSPVEVEVSITGIRIRLREGA